MGYITEQRLDGPREVVTGAVCDNCLSDLKFDDDPNHKLVLGAMDLVLIGGYGRYFDDQDVRVIICRDCVDKLLAAFPFLAKAMDEQGTR